jgi:hypothetical protein
MAPLSVYFSQSWKHNDSPLNLQIWNKLASCHCSLLMDTPEIPEGEIHPPYYISRMESLFRRADIFVACLPGVESGSDSKNAGRRGSVVPRRFSPYILFEIRMAERMGMPRFILFDRASDFRPPNNPPANAKYVGVHFKELRQQIADGDAANLSLKPLQNWLNECVETVIPALSPYQEKLGILMTGPQSAEIRDELRSLGAGDVVEVNKGILNDAHFFERLRSLSCLVADVSDSKLLAEYSAAHSLMVPSIRVTSGIRKKLPWFLKGHAKGYEEDIVNLNSDDAIDSIINRAEACLKPFNPVTNHDRGKFILQERAYTPHFVFLSHASKRDDRASEPYRRELIDEIIRQCRKAGITIWEYDQQNSAASEWRPAMELALQEMTHLVALITGCYTDSEACMDELRAANERELKMREKKGEPFTLLPYLSGGRVDSCQQVTNRNITQKRLPVDESCASNAAVIVSDIIATIRRA